MVQSLVVNQKRTLSLVPAMMHETGDQEIGDSSTGVGILYPLEIGDHNEKLSGASLRASAAATFWRAFHYQYLCEPSSSSIPIASP